MDWTKLEKLQGIAEINELKMHLKVALAQKGAPPQLEFKIYQDMQGRFQAVSNLVPNQKGLPAKPGMARPGMAQPAARPGMAQPAPRPGMPQPAPRPGMAQPAARPGMPTPRPGTGSLTGTASQPPSLANLLETERYDSAEEALVGVVATILRMAKDFPTLAWDPNPAF